MANYFAEKRQREASVSAEPVPPTTGENYFARKREEVEPQEPDGSQWREPQTPPELAFAASITAPPVQPQPALQRTEQRMGAALASAVPQGAMQRMGKEGGLPSSIQGADETTMRAIQRTPGVVGRGALASLRSFGSSIDQAVADTVAAGEVATAEQYEAGNIQPVNPEGKRRWMSPGDIARDIAAQNAPGASERAFEAEMAQGRASRATRRYQADAAAAIPADAGPVERAIQSGLTSAAVTIPIVTAGAMIPGGQVPALVALGGIEGAQRYGQLRAAGFDEGPAALSAGYIGGLAGLTEAIPLGTLAKQSPFVKRAAEFLVQDVLGENISSAAQIADDYRLQLRDDVTMADIKQALQDTTAATIVGAGAQITASGLMGLVIDQANARAQARELAIEQPQIDVEAPTFGDESMQVEQTFPSEEVTLEGDGELQPDVPVVDEATTQVEEAPAGEDITLEGDGEMLPGEIRVEETPPEEVTLQTDPMEEFQRQDEDLATDEELADVEIEEPGAGPPAAVIGSRGTEPENPTMAQRRDLLKAKHHAIEVNVRPDTKPRDITYVQSPDGLHGVAISGEPVAWYGSAELAREEVRAVRRDIADRSLTKPAIDAAAHQAASSPTNDRTESFAQIDANNRALGHLPRIHGMEISIENPIGSIRRSKPDAPVKWEREIKGAHYGYIRGTTDNTDEHVDVFVGPHLKSNKAFVIDQLTADGKTFDEPKTLLGFNTLEQARKTYLSNYQVGWAKNIGAITEMSVPEFKKWVKSPSAKKPVAWKPTTATAVSGTASAVTKPEVARPAEAQHDKRIPKRADQLRSMAARAGWQEIGGRAITDEDSVNPQVLNRTKWLPHESWFAEVQREAPLTGNTAGKATAAAVTKAIAGEKLTAAETRHVKAMLDRMDADDAEVARLASQLDNDPAGMTDAELAAFERRLERMALQMEGQQKDEDQPAIPTGRGVRSDEPMFERTGKGQGDLFGNANEVKTALKKIEAERDRRRNTGQESVETGKPDDLFSESRKQTPMFARGKTEKLYRGEYSGNKGGGFYTSDKEFARQFTQGGLDSEIKSLSLDAIDIFEPTNDVYAGDPDAVDVAVRDAIKAGKRAVRLSEGKGQPKSVLLVDRWKFENDDPMARRTEGQQAGKLGEREVRTEVNRILREFKTRPRLTVVQSYDQLPKDLLAANERRGIKAGDVRAIQWNGGIYFVANEYTNLDDIRNSVVHETTIHFGLRAVIGRAAYHHIVDGIARDQPMAVRRQGHREFGDRFDWNNLDMRQIAAEEVLAYYAPQYLASKPVPDGMRKWIQELIAKMAAFLRRVFNAPADLKLPKTYSAQAMGRLIDDLQTFLKEGRTSNVMADAAAMAQRNDQFDTPAFKKWFSKSKVVDASGRPLIVYHGTRDRDRVRSEGFRRSDDGGIYFTSTTREAFRFGHEYKRFGANAKVERVYLRMENPLVMDAKGELFEPSLLENAIKRAENDDHDGVIVKNIQNFEGGEITDTYVVFEPAQIKAIGNRGTFDPLSDNIMFERAQPQSEVMLRTIPKKSGEARGYAGVANRIIDGFNNKFGWRYGALGRLPGAKEYLVERYKTLGALTQVREITRDIFSTLSQASTEDSERVYAYLTTAGATADSIENQKIRDAAIHVKEAIDTQGRALVDAGLLSEESYETYKDQYLPRLYLRHILDDGKGRKAMGTGKKLSDMGYLKQRKDIPEEVRKVSLGEITDPAFLSAFGLSRTMRDLAIMNFLDTISQNKAWTPEVMMVEWEGRKVSPFWLAEEAAHLRRQADHLRSKPAIAEKARRIADQMDTLANGAIEAMQGVDLADFEQIPNSARYGALRGLYVRKEIHEDLVGAYNMIQTDSLLENIFGQGGALTKLGQAWKTSKVALNVPSHFRNMMGNTIMMHLSGVPLHRVPQRMVQALDSVIRKDNFYQIAVKYGLKEATFANRELSRIRDEWILLQKSKQPTTNVIHAMGAKFVNAVGDVYQFEEAIFKIAKLIDGMERQGLSEADAMIESHKWVFDYSLVPRAVRYLRNAPFGIPFLSYSYFALPRMAEAAIKRPWVYLPYIAAGYALQEAVMAAFGAGEDELRKLKNAFPDWMKRKGGMYLMPRRDEEGRLQMIDLGYTVPWGMLADTMAQVSQGEFRQSAETLGLLSGPIPDVVAAWQTGIDPFTGREIAAPGDTAGMKAMSYLSYAWGMAAPGFLTDKGAFGKVKDAHGVRFFHDGKLVSVGAPVVDPKSGEPGLTKTQAWLRLFGVSVYPVDPEATRKRNISSMNFEIDETQRSRSEKLKNKNLDEASKEEIRRVFKKELDRKKEALKLYKLESEVPEVFKSPSTDDLTSELAPLITGKSKAEAVAAIREAGYPEFAALWDAMPAKPRPVVAKALQEQQLRS